MNAKQLLKDNKSLLEEFEKLSLIEQESFLKELEKKKKKIDPPRAEEHPSDENGL